MSPSRSIRSLAVVTALFGAGAIATASWLLAPQADPVRQVTLYYADSQGMVLVPITASLSAPSEPAAWARTVFETLRGPRGDKLAAPLPADAKLLEAAWAAPRWTLGVQLARPLGSTDERLLVGALVRTFTGGWPGAREVRLKLLDAQGRPLASQHLDLSAPLTLADVANTLEAAPGNGGIKSTLWWPAKDGGTLVPVQIALTGGSGIPPRDALERLVAGPPAEAGGFLAGVVPPGARPAWVSLDAGVARIEVGGKLADAEPARRFVEATVLTLTEFPDVRAVQFLLGGRPPEQAVGTFKLSAPIARPVGAPEAATRGSETR